MMSTKLDEMKRLSKKLDSSLLLQSMFDIDWDKGEPTRYAQTKYIAGEQQVYKSWIQQGDLKIMLSSSQYEKLSGKVLNKDQIKKMGILLIY